MSGGKGDGSPAGFGEAVGRGVTFRGGGDEVGCPSASRKRRIRSSSDPAGAGGFAWFD